jgi:Pyruvate/2-oxoacid:ferredoxin oxidoreductase delta subunit
VDAGTNRSFGGIDRLYKRVKALSATVYWYLTQGRPTRRRWVDAKREGARISLDALGPPVRAREAHERPADFTPNPGRLKKSRLMKLDAYPATDYSFEISNLPVSGNQLNGQSEAEYRPASPIFHTWQYQHPMGKLEFMFQASRTPSELLALLKRQWLSFATAGSVSATRRNVDDPQEMTREIKADVKQMGAEMVGVTPLTLEMKFDSRPLPDLPHVIVFAVRMEREAALWAPSEKSALTIQAEYRHCDRIAADMAKNIRALGWQAEAAIHNLLHIPAAVNAGLGQLGKHGSLIAKQAGSMYRLGAIVTDLPLQYDEPEDIGVDDFCATCQICTTNCPPQAILQEKQLLRGNERWYVDFDKCIPYFVENHGCGICIGVCPWSEEGSGEKLMQKIFSKRKKQNDMQSSQVTTG